jgi:CHASE3 domain sensor protein
VVAGPVGAGEGPDRARGVALATTNLTIAADQMLADVLNAETGVRGYAATGDPLFLQPYHLALSRLGADRLSLRDAAITEGDSRQQRVANAAGALDSVLVPSADQARPLPGRS